jgi:uncharacterized protein (DUF3820 family)
MDFDKYQLLKNGRMIIDLPVELKRSFRAKTGLEGVTMKSKIIEWITKYLESEV